MARRCLRPHRTCVHDLCCARQRPRYARRQYRSPCRSGRQKHRAGAGRRAEACGLAQGIAGHVDDLRRRPRAGAVWRSSTWPAMRCASPTLGLVDPSMTRRLLLDERQRQLDARSMRIGHMQLHKRPAARDARLVHAEAIAFCRISQGQNCRRWKARPRSRREVLPLAGARAAVGGAVLPYSASARAYVCQRSKEFAALVCAVTVAESGDSTPSVGTPAIRE